jgi:alpha-glucosidase
VTEDDDPRTKALGQRQIYNMHRPEVHDVLRRWRGVADGYTPQRVLVGETWELDPAALAAFYGPQQDELHLAFNFPFALSPLDVERLRPIVDETEAQIGARGWPVWTASNHDIGRLATRWCAGDERKVRCALMLLISLRGTPFLYAGDEIGLQDRSVAREDLRDPVGLRHWPDNPGRDGGRTPMPWSSAPGGGFTAAGVRPWLPLGDAASCNVADQRRDEGSVLHLTRSLTALRREMHDLRRGSYETLPGSDGLWVWRRGSDVTVAINLSDRGTTVDAPSGLVVRVATDPDRAGERVDGRLLLRPWEGAILTPPV